MMEEGGKEEERRHGRRKEEIRKIKGREEGRRWWEEGEVEMEGGRKEERKSLSCSPTDLAQLPALALGTHTPLPKPGISISEGQTKRKQRRRETRANKRIRPVKPYMEALGEEGRIVLPHRSAPHPLSPHGPLRGPGPAGPTGSHRGRKSRLTKRPWTEAAGLGSGRAGVGPRIVRLLGGLVLTLCPHAPHCWAGPFMILFGGVCLWPQPPPTPSRHCPPDRAQDPSLSWPPSSPRCLGTPESQPPSVPRRHWGLQAPACPQ